MTFLYICLILASYMTGFLTSHFLKKKEANQRKGLVNKSFSGKNGFGKVTIESQFEILELERLWSLQILTAVQTRRKR